MSDNMTTGGPTMPGRLVRCTSLGARSSTCSMMPDTPVERRLQSEPERKRRELRGPAQDARNVRAGEASEPSEYRHCPDGRIPLAVPSQRRHCRV